MDSILDYIIFVSQTQKVLAHVATICTALKQFQMSQSTMRLQDSRGICYTDDVRVYETSRECAL